MSLPHTLAVRLDSLGDVLLQGPALRAIAAGSRRVTLLCGPRGRAAARLLPGVDDLLTFNADWIDPEPGPLDRGAVLGLVSTVRVLAPQVAVIFTSYHQSPLPTAMLLRLAGVPRIGAISDDYPGSLLDVRLRRTERRHEVERSLDLAAAMGFPLRSDDDGRMRVSLAAPLPPELAAGVPYVVLHPGASVPARRWPMERFRALGRLLHRRGWRVVVTGDARDRDLCADVVAALPGAVDLAGACDLGTLSTVLSRARVIIVGNTGPAHLAAAAGTPVVSLFSPVVPAWAWRPWGVPQVLLGDQSAPCAGTRARVCPVAGHPCLAAVDEHTVLAAVESLVGADPVGGAAR